MCKCTPEIKTPYCGAPGCRWPEDATPGGVTFAPEPLDKPALQVQVGGDHYKDMAIQPVEYIHRNGIGFCEGSVIKYVSRWRKKNGVEDLKKARHFLDLLIEMESKNTP